MKRRDLFKMTGALAAVVPGAAAVTAAPEIPWKPQVLNAHQNETIIVISDLIIPETDTPGAKAANVNRYIDLFLSVTPADQTENLIGGLGWLDRYTNQQHGHAFTSCSKDQQIAILEALAANQQPGLETGHAFFDTIKGITTRFYYNTAIGFRELNKGGRMPSTFGCAHGGHA
ncbi:MAG TPA: gluconate 2-dehydrogenase subunit 3 family protein [Bryobacteraceae bacterium]|jgi:hypothetical protein